MVYAIVFSLIIFIAVVFIAMQFGGGANTQKRQNELLSNLQSERSKLLREAQEENISILKSDAGRSGHLLMAIPGGKYLYSQAMRAGMIDKAGNILVALIGIFLLVTFVAKSVGAKIWLAPILGIVLSYFLINFYLKRKIKKRNEIFINMFPDAVDMIVRSVKSGHPLNTALRMIAENMEPPISTEFRKLTDEIAFGRSTTEALLRMSKRIDEPDLHFFVVILSVQQETGGNLAEVLSNLSNIIRKRKQLRLKIKAMTSEGRATGYILGALPFVVFAALKYTSPDYLDPLFTTESGMMVLGGAIFLIALAGFVVHNMLQIDI